MVIQERQRQLLEAWWCGCQTNWDLVYRCRSCFRWGWRIHSQKQKERQTMGVSAGRLVTVDVHVPGNSPSIAPVCPAKQKVNGLSAAGEEEISKERTYEIVIEEPGRVMDQVSSGLASLTCDPPEVRGHEFKWNLFVDMIVFFSSRVRQPRFGCRTGRD